MTVLIDRGSANQAQIRSRSATASESRFRTIIPQPSDRTKPSARASDALHRPSADIMWAFEKEWTISGRQITSLRLPMPSGIDRCSQYRQALCTATKEEEQPVSIAKFGPSIPSV